MEFFANCTNFLLHDIVSLFLVAEHKFHKVQFALHKTFSRNCGIDVCDVLWSRFVSIDNILCSWHWKASSFWNCSSSPNRDLSTTNSVIENPLSWLLELRWKCSVISLLQLLIENSSLLVYFDDWFPSIVMNNSSPLVMDFCASLEQILISWVFVWHLNFMSNSDVWVDDGILCTWTNHSIWIIWALDICHVELACPCLVINISDSIMFFVDVECSFSSWHF